MGLFEDLGRTVESFKQQAEKAAEEDAAGKSAAEEDAAGESAAEEDAAGKDANRECADCGEPVHVDRSECPSCGGDVVAVGLDDG